jgi:sulfide:quinone oxidoreductase
MTASHASDHGREVDVAVVTPASAPLSLFGPAAVEAMTRLLTERGITVHGGSDVEVPERGRVLLGDDPALSVDRVVALPRLYGPSVPGLPRDRDGFIPVDEHGRVDGAPGVWAAGDCTTFPVKQGGIASQQADAVAAAIAADAGADVEAAPFAPVLRGVLLTGKDPSWMRHEMGGGDEAHSVSSTALWWPPSKVAGRYLAPALGTIDDSAALTDPDAGVPVEVRLEIKPADHPRVRRRAIIARAAGSTDPELIDFGPGGAGL